MARPADASLAPPLTRPADAETVIVGGGAVGCAVAYFLARHGRHDVALLERDELASGTTSQAAGLVGQVRASAARVRLAMFSVRTFLGLEAETGGDPDYRPVGSLRLALTDEREAEFRRMVAVSRAEGLEVDFVPLGEVARRWPPLDLSGVRAALWCPSDGYVQPYGLTMAYARGARRLGARIHTGTRVVAIRAARGEVTGVATDAGEIRARTVVVAAGPWAGRLAATAGVELPIVPVRHQYFVTQPVPGIAADLPVLRIPDRRLYVRAELGGLLVGGFEADAASVDPRGLPDDFRRLALDPEWAPLAGFGQDAQSLLPSLADAAVRSTFQGLPTFTPDGHFCLGPVPGIRGLVMAAGCCAHGVSGSAGLGVTVAAMILGEAPLVDPGPVRAARFPATPIDWEPTRRAAERVYAGYYAVSPAPTV